MNPHQINFESDNYLEFGDVAISPTFERIVVVPDLSDIVASWRVYPPLDYQPELVVPPEFFSIVDEVLISPDPIPLITTHYGSSFNAEAKYNITVLAEGYSFAEKAKFFEDVDRWVEHLSMTEPFVAYMDLINVFSVFRSSSDGGEPPLIGLPQPSGPYYWGYGSEVRRCLAVVDKAKMLSDALLSPGLSDKPVVFINTDEDQYGGCARSDYLTSHTNEPDGPLTATHELGHMMGLGDEYEPDTLSGPGLIGGPIGCGEFDEDYYGEPNLTTDPTCSKWMHWFGYGAVGCVQGGGGPRGSSLCVWRPTPSCAMRDKDVPFCPVCKEALALHLRGHVSPLRSVSGPTSHGSDYRFEVSTSFADPLYCPKEISWYVDGVKQGANGWIFFLPKIDDAESVSVDAKDQCHYVRHDPGNLMSSGHTFHVPD